MRWAFGVGVRFVRSVSERAHPRSLPPRVEEAVKDKLKRSTERLRRGRGGDGISRKGSSRVDGVRSMSAVEVLNAEIAVLRSVGLPEGVESVTDPETARYVTLPGGSPHEATAGVVPNPDLNTGPWHVHSYISGERNSGYHRASVHFRFSFSNLYPREPPDVHILSVCHHALVDDDKEVSSLFYHPENLPAKRIGMTKEKEKIFCTSDVAKNNSSDTSGIEFLEYDLRSVLVAARSFLSKPLLIPGDQSDKLVAHHRKHVGEQWQSAASMNERRDEIIDKYLVDKAGGGPKDARLFSKNGWPREFFHPTLLNVLEEIQEKDALEPMNRATRMNIIKNLCREEAPGIYSFPMLTPEACSALITEIEHFSSDQVSLPVRRPNSMNNHGVVINEMGMERAVDWLQENILQKIAEALYPDQGGGCLTSHHSFVVQYKEGLDLGLDMHTDDADVTFNACLGKEFEASGLTFCGVLGADVKKGNAPHRKVTALYAHEVGRCVAHLGAHRHGADDLIYGERLNLIVWNQSSTYRASDAYRWRDVPEETEAPDPKCLSFTHDKDFGTYKKYPPNVDGDALKSNAWYPPSEEYVKMK